MNFGRGNSQLKKRRYKSKGRTMRAQPPQKQYRITSMVNGRLVTRLFGQSGKVMRGYRVTDILYKMNSRFYQKLGKKHDSSNIINHLVDMGIATRIEVTLQQLRTLQGEQLQSFATAQINTLYPGVPTAEKLQKNFVMSFMALAGNVDQLIGRNNANKAAMVQQMRSSVAINQLEQTNLDKWHFYLFDPMNFAMKQDSVVMSDEWYENAGYALLNQTVELLISQISTKIADLDKVHPYRPPFLLGEFKDRDKIYYQDLTGEVNLGAFDVQDYLERMPADELVSQSKNLASLDENSRQWDSLKQFKNDVITLISPNYASVRQRAETIPNWQELLAYSKEGDLNIDISPYDEAKWNQYRQAIVADAASRQTPYWTWKTKRQYNLEFSNNYILAVPVLNEAVPPLRIDTLVYRNMSFYRQRETALFTKLRFQTGGYKNTIIPQNMEVAAPTSYDRLQGKAYPVLSRTSKSNLIIEMNQEDIRTLVFDKPLLRMAFSMWGMFEYDSIPIRNLHKLVFQQTNFQNPLETMKKLVKAYGFTKKEYYAMDLKKRAQVAVEKEKYISYGQLAAFKKRSTYIFREFQKSTASYKKASDMVQTKAINGQLRDQVSSYLAEFQFINPVSMQIMANTMAVILKVFEPSRNIVMRINNRGFSGGINTYQANGQALMEGILASQKPYSVNGKRMQAPMLAVIDVIIQYLTSQRQAISSAFPSTNGVLDQADNSRSSWYTYLQRELCAEFFETFMLNLLMYQSGDFKGINDNDFSVMVSWQGTWYMNFMSQLGYYANYPQLDLYTISTPMAPIAIGTVQFTPNVFTPNQDLTRLQIEQMMNTASKNAVQVSKLFIDSGIIRKPREQKVAVVNKYTTLHAGEQMNWSGYVGVDAAEQHKLFLQGLEAHGMQFHGAIVDLNNLVWRSTIQTTALIDRLMESNQAQPNRFVDDDMIFENDPDVYQPNDRLDEQVLTAEQQAQLDNAVDEEMTFERRQRANRGLAQMSSDVAGDFRRQVTRSVRRSILRR